MRSMRFRYSLRSAPASYGRGQPEGTHALTIGPQCSHRPRIDRAFEIASFEVRLARWYARQYLDAIVNRADGIDMKHAVSHRRDYLFTQHQIAHVGFGDEHALLSRQAASLTNMEE